MADPSCVGHALTADSFLVTDDEVRVIKVPPFAESLTEGDIRWEKSE